MITEFNTPSGLREYAEQLIRIAGNLLTIANSMDDGLKKNMEEI